MVPNKCSQMNQSCYFIHKPCHSDVAEKEVQIIRKYEFQSNLQLLTMLKSNYDRESQLEKLAN